MLRGQFQNKRSLSTSRASRLGERESGDGGGMKKRRGKKGKKERQIWEVFVSFGRMRQPMGLLRGQFHRLDMELSRGILSFHIRGSRSVSFPSSALKNIRRES